MRFDDAYSYLEEIEEEGVRGKKRKRRPDGVTGYDHAGAYNRLRRDHVGPDALFGKEFQHSFRLSRPRVQIIQEQLGNSGDPYYKGFVRDRFGRLGPSLEAKILLPLKILVNGVDPECICDCFNMSPMMAESCVKRFNQAIPKLFSDEFMRLPTVDDLKAVTALHKRVHGVDGMFGSLDSMHTCWENCPVPSTKSGSGNYDPAIFLEAIADYNGWFWHASYGYTGYWNELKVLKTSPLMRTMTDGSFSSLEKQAGVVPFSIGEEAFDKLFVLVDYVYPDYSRFVKHFTYPITDVQIRFTSWQDRARRDLERAFDELTGKFKALSPLQLCEIEVKAISPLLNTCMILHNMAVSDKVMGNATERYCPSNVDLASTSVPSAATDATVVPPDHGRSITAKTVARRKDWKGLKDDAEWARLFATLINFKGTEEIQEAIGSVTPLSEVNSP